LSKFDDEGNFVSMSNSIPEISRPVRGRNPDERIIAPLYGGDVDPREQFRAQCNNLLGRPALLDGGGGDGGAKASDKKPERNLFRPRNLELFLCWSSAVVGTAVRVPSFWEIHFQIETTREACFLNLKHPHYAVEAT